jgi:hypothetical protein
LIQSKKKKTGVGAGVVEKSFRIQFTTESIFFVFMPRKLFFGLDYQMLSGLKVGENCSLILLSGFRFSFKISFPEKS